MERYVRVRRAKKLTDFSGSIWSNSRHFGEQ
jgi:hypothetical protein